MKIKYLFFLLIIIITHNIWANEKRVEFQPKLFTWENSYYLALEYRHFNGWHTYYKNPGESGEPTSFEFTINQKKVDLVELEWPTPQAYDFGGINTYVYSNTLHLFFKIPQSLIGKNLHIKTKWLSCKKVCIPGEDSKTITLNKQAFTSSKELLENLKRLPVLSEKPASLMINMTRDQMNQKLVLYYKFKNKLTSFSKKVEAFLIPLPTKNFTFKKERLIRDINNTLTGVLEATWEGEFEEPPLPFPDLETLQKTTFKFHFIDPNLGQAVVFNHQFKSMNQVRNIHVKSKSSAPDSIWYYLLFALIGGFILNFMPCVLPVISLKLFGLIQNRDEDRAKIFKHNLGYTIGVLLTFIALAAVVTILKYTGMQVGWGFQLQSPTFIVIMAIVLYFFSLNMFGLYEIMTPGGRTLGNINIKDSFLGDMFGGIIAVILSTPCSAPFLGTALAFAFTSPPIFIFLFFIVIGIGLSLPFILTGIFPKALVLLPRPGNWMNWFKKFLGLTLLATSIWLISILASLVLNFELALMTFLSIFISAWAGFFILKRSKLKPLGYLGILGSIIFSVLLIFNVSQITSINTANSNQLIEAKRKQGLNFEVWSPDKMGKASTIRFVDFTAKWCLTCKINEQVVINTKGFKKIVKQYNVQLLLADWTSGDPVITKWLKEHGYAGVPAYFTVSKDGKLYDLGETITVKEIEESFKKASP